MLDNLKIIMLVRNPDDRQENDGIITLTRQRVLELYSETEEMYLQDGALLVQHPYLHQSCRSKLLPADNLYTAIREEAEGELFGALVNLGATEVELEQIVGEAESNSKGGAADIGVKGVKVGGQFEEKKSYKSRTGRRLRLAIHPKVLDLSTLNKVIFFDKLIYNKGNTTLKLLFDGIKAGDKFKEYEIEFKHSISRAYKLESAINTNYFELFKAEINFQHEFEKNRVESALLIAKFGNSL